MGNLSLVTSLDVLFVLDAGFRARRTIPVSAAIPVALVLIMFSFYGAAKGKQRTPRSTAISAICMLTFVVPSGGVGFGIGIRLVLSKADTRHEYLYELRHCLKDIVRVIFGPRSYFGTISRCAALAASVVLKLGFRARSLIPLSAAIIAVSLHLAIGVLPD